MSAPDDPSPAAPPAEVSTWHGPPRQARSRETLERLLAAGEALLAEHGYDGMRLRDVAAAAGLSVGAIYQRFPDKESFYTALQQRFIARVRGEMGPRFAPEAWQERNAGEIVALLVELVVGTFRDHSGLLRAFLRRRVNAPNSEPPLRRFGSQVSRVMAELLRDRPGTPAGDDLDERVAIGMQVVFSTAVHAILNRPEPLGIDDSRLAPELTQIFTGYLGIEAPASRSTARGPRGAA